MKNSILFFALLLCLVACKESPKQVTTTETPTTQPQPANAGGSQNDADLKAITDVVHNFYKWYESFQSDEKRQIDFLDSKSKVTKLIPAKVAAFHAELMKSGFLSQAYIDNDMAYLKKYEAEWLKNKENNNDGPLSGLDYDRVICGQDGDLKAFQTKSLKVEGLGTNQVKAAIEASKLELVKENGKWLISKIICE